MAGFGQDLVDRFGELMSNGDIDGLAELYALDAKVVLFYRVASGHDEIRQLLASRLASHGHYNVVSVDQFQDAGDVVMWDATVETEIGPLQTTHVVVLNAEGLIQHHVPAIRGYWGM
jgi:ketosteroid isomerase-like protein